MELLGIKLKLNSCESREIILREVGTLLKYVQSLPPRPLGLRRERGHPTGNKGICEMNDALQIPVARGLARSTRPKRLTYSGARVDT